LGNINSWAWNFGDGTSSNENQPPAHLYPDNSREMNYLVSLIVGNSLGCYDTSTLSIAKLQSCAIAVPGAFTPNGDGKNDYLYPLNAFQVSNLQFMIFNRLGQLIFQSRDASKKWDGTINGLPQPTGAYVWTLSYNDGASGKKIFLRGTSVLIR
jgi:gliding motility-associated-like protein